MRKRSVLIISIFFAGVLMLASFGISAEKDVQDVIRMEEKAYETHQKGIVEFPHRDHYREFSQKHPDLFENGCGECHHDDDGEPLSELQPGDAVEKCIECHEIPGRMPRSIKKQMREQKLSLSERKTRELEYHAEVMHDKCRGCHRKFYKKTKSRKAPTTCFKCHPKK